MSHQHSTVDMTLVFISLRKVLQVTCNIWLFPSPGSPTIRMWGSALTGMLFLPVCFCLPPNKTKARAAFTSCRYTKSQELQETQDVRLNFSIASKTSLAAVKLIKVEVVKADEFKYLGSTIQRNGQCRGELKKRVQVGWSRWRWMSRGDLWQKDIRKSEREGLKGDSERSAMM